MSSFETISPIDGSILFSRNYASTAEINTILDKAFKARKSWQDFGPAVGSLWRDVQALAEGHGPREHQLVEEGGLQSHQVLAVALQG